MIRCNTVLLLILSASTARLAQNSADNLQRVFDHYYSELSSKITEKAALGKKSSNAKWTMLDTSAMVLESDRSPVDIAMRRTLALIRDLQSKGVAIPASAESLMTCRQRSGIAPAQDRRAFAKIMVINRALALSNPLVDFDTILFSARGIPGEGNESGYHICDQYFGYNGMNGGSIYLATGIRSDQVQVVDLMQSRTVAKGRYAGKSLAGGSFISPELSYDGKTIFFGWKEGVERQEVWSLEQCYHLFKMNIDGPDIVQLTDGPYNDFAPCEIPNGRIVFVSDRRGGFGRCHPRKVPTYTLYSMKADGSDMVCISFHETNEWDPSVDYDGRLVYSRWDYIDRDDCIAHHIWTCYADGRDPRAPHGNYPLPWGTMEGSDFPDGRNFRPNGETNIRAIPGMPQYYVAVVASHHAPSYGELVLLNTNIADDNKMSQVKNITINTQSWGDWGGAGGPWATPFPLSESWFLASFSGDIVLVDKSGNRQVLVERSRVNGAAADKFRLLDPIPLKPRLESGRPRDPAVPATTWQGERSTAPDHCRAMLSVLSVYEGDMPLPEGTVIKEMRIIQVIPQALPLVNQTRIGYASEALARMVLGTVPVESDGSVYCEAPVGKEIYFQLLDDKGMAVQSMRTGTYVHPGEHLSCIGCHEDKWKATPSNVSAMAFRRPPSKLTPEVGGLEPVNFHRLVRIPVFEKKCTPCHRDRGQGPDMSYGSLQNHAFFFCRPPLRPDWPYLSGDITTPIVGGSRTTPGKFGARFAGLTRYCTPDHYGVQLTPEELRRVTLWLDCNSNEFGAYTRTDEQRAGKLVWPEIDCDSTNPSGVESSFPIQGTVFSGTPGQLRQSTAPTGASIAGKTLVLDCGRGAPRRTYAVQLFDARGRCAMSRRIEIAGGRTCLTTPKFAAGAYVVRLRSKDAVNRGMPIRIIEID
jgi:hypothetical protein